MPIYEYQCQACGKRLEEIQKFSDSPLVDCPSCGKPSLSRLISKTSFQLKGGGYYATDYKDPPKEKEVKEDNQEVKKESVEDKSKDVKESSKETPKE